LLRRLPRAKGEDQGRRGRPTLWPAGTSAGGLPLPRFLFGERVAEGTAYRRRTHTAGWHRGTYRSPRALEPIRSSAPAENGGHGLQGTPILGPGRVRQPG